MLNNYNVYRIWCNLFVWKVFFVFRLIKYKIVGEDKEIYGFWFGESVMFFLGCIMVINGEKFWGLLGFDKFGGRER